MDGEKLIIRNFGPIKEVNINLRKYNFIIGNQASGKSTILKTLTILRDIRLLFLPVDLHVRKMFMDFNLSSYLNKDTFIEYSNEAFKVTVKGLGKPKLTVIDTSDEASKTLKMLSKLKGFVTQDIYPEVEEYLRKESVVSIYIPAERIIIPNITYEPFKYSGKEVKLPEYLRSFGNYFTEARKQISKLKVDWLKLSYSYERGIDTIVYKGKKMRLVEAATGFQVVLPLIMVIERHDNLETKNKPLISYFIEEPELSLFPQTQNQLIKYLVMKCRGMSTSFFISTHSPYILSTINNLLYAHKVGDKNSKKAEQIIAKKYWIDPKDVTALFLNEKGMTDDLMDHELNLLKVEKIDEISHEINIEYDKLNDVLWSK